MVDRAYTVSFAGQTLTAPTDAFEIVALDDKPIELFGLTFDCTSEVGDAAEEFISYFIMRATGVTSGSGGASAGANPTDERLVGGSPPTAETMNTTLASGGLPQILHQGAFNERVGERLWLPEGAGVRTNQGTGPIIVRISSTPADAVLLTGTAYIREL